MRSSKQNDYLNEVIFLKEFHNYIHTYIIGHYNLSVRITDLISHTAYVVCDNFIYKWRDLKSKVDSEQQIFSEAFHGNFIYFQSFC